MLGLAVAAETHLKHPVADAIRIRARELALEIPVCDEAQYHVGLGVEGQVNGNYVHVGSERFMRFDRWNGNTAPLSSATLMARPSPTKSAPSDDPPR